MEKVKEEGKLNSLEVSHESNVNCNSSNAWGQIEITLINKTDPSLRERITLPQDGAVTRQTSSQDIEKDNYWDTKTIRVDVIRAYGCFCWAVYTATDYQGTWRILQPGCQIVWSKWLNFASLKNIDCKNAKSQNESPY